MRRAVAVAALRKLRRLVEVERLEEAENRRLAIRLGVGLAFVTLVSILGFLLHAR